MRDDQPKKYSHIGNQFVLIIAGIIFIALISNAFYQYFQEKQRAYDALLQRGQSIGTLLTSISIDPLLVYDNQTINDFATNSTSQSGVVYTFYFDNEITPLTSYIDTSSPNIISAVSSSDSVDPTIIIKQLHKDKELLHLTFPVVFETQQLATLHIGLDKKPLTSTPLENLKTQIISSLFFGLFIGIGAYIGIVKRISRPVKKLKKAATSISNFEFDEELEIPGNNELTELADTFNQMRLTLKEAVVSRENTLKQMEDLNSSLEDRVSERTLALEELNTQITHQAMHDSLTGLPNRALIIDRLNQAIEYANRNNTRLAVFILDLNNFKEINDTLGHPEGDIILKHVAYRIPGALRASDTVGRLGGDEFAVVLPEIDEEHALSVGKKIVEVLKPGFELTNQVVDMSASIGISIYPEHGEDQSALIRHADVAMYESKKHGNHVTIYNSEIDTHTPWRLALMADLRIAIEKDELELYYQPQIDLKNHQVYGVEALIRWNHKTQGFIPPDQFIHFAENSGLINALSEWVICKAVLQLSIWQKSGLNIDVSINISARNLLDPTLPEKLYASIQKHKASAEHIKLEFTESTIMSNPEMVLGLMNNSKLKGVRYSIDDFGTGYSSLSYLKRLPVDEVKIDKSFILDMDKNDEDASIVKSVIDLTHTLGHAVVAEGIESENIMNILKDLGCDYAQGYFYSKPVPATEISQTIDKINSVEFYARKNA